MPATKTTATQTSPTVINIGGGGGIDITTLLLLGAVGVAGYFVWKKFAGAPPDVTEGQIGNAGAVLASKDIALNITDPQATVTLNIDFTIARQGRPALGQGWYAEVNSLDAAGSALSQIIIPSLVGWGFENDPTQAVSKSVNLGALPSGIQTITVKVKAQDYPHLFGQATGQYSVTGFVLTATTQGGGGVGPGTGYRVTIEQVNTLQGVLVLQDDRLYQAGEYASVSGVGAGFLTSQWHVSSWFINGREYAVDKSQSSQSFTAPDGSPVTVQNFPGSLNNKSVVTFKVSGAMRVGAHYGFSLF